MDIHKPKPWHGWRELLKEIGTIVIGVLIALGAEQGVEWLHRHDDLSRTRQALKRELAKDAMGAAFSSREDACYLAVLAKYAAWARGGPQPPRPNLGLPPLYSNVWETVKTGAVPNMDLDERLAFARFYNNVEGFNELRVAERDGARELEGYAYQERLTPADAGAVLRGVGRLQNLLRWKISGAGGVVRFAQGLGAAPDRIPADAEARVDGICAQAGAQPPQWPR